MYKMNDRLPITRSVVEFTNRFTRARNFTMPVFLVPVVLRFRRFVFFFFSAYIMSAVSNTLFEPSRPYPLNALILPLYRNTLNVKDLTDEVTQNTKGMACINGHLIDRLV